MDEPVHTIVGPLIAPADGNGFTVKLIVAAVPHPVEYVNVTVPAVTPLTPPFPEPIVAVPASLDVHVPPVVASDSVTVPPIHTFVAPVIAVGAVCTVIVCVAIVLPQALVTVYFIVSTPEATPVTDPETDIVATEVAELLQTPPDAVLVNDTAESEQIVIGPDNVPAFGSGFTVIVL
jgi:hypothetical protein